MALLQAVPSIQPGSERPVLILIECACTSAHLCPAVWDLVHSHRRDAGAEGGTHDPFYEDVCGSLWRGCNRLFGISAFLASPASTQASTYEVAQINPDQITRNAPRDLPSFEQKYQMHTGVLDTLRR